MEAICPKVTTFITLCNNFPHKSQFHLVTSTINFSNSQKYNNTHLNLSLSSRFVARSSLTTNDTATPVSVSTDFASSGCNRHWMVVMDKPPPGTISKAETINYFVDALERVLGNVKDAQMSIYDVSLNTHFGFCCDIDIEASRELARLPGVLSVRPDPDYNSEKKNYSLSNSQLRNLPNSLVNLQLFPSGATKHWIVRINKPGVEVVTKPQMVDYYTQLLTKVLGSEKDAQMCIYNVSWQSNFGFCCELDDESANELADVPGVSAVEPDMYFESENKDYGGNNLENPGSELDSSEQPPVKTKKLFITGLSFYTSEKTLRAAFESFGQLVQVKIIMDKISKRSKGYAFIEYTTEEAAGAALKEMNGKIINGWMIVVDVAKTKPSRFDRAGP